MADIFPLYEKVQDIILNQIIRLDDQYHEHVSDCEQCCPKKAMRVALFNITYEVDSAFQPYIAKEHVDGCD